MQDRYNGTGQTLLWTFSSFSVLSRVDDDDWSDFEAASSDPGFQEDCQSQALTHVPDDGDSLKHFQG
jgi:hypothetical protein